MIGVRFIVMIVVGRRWRRFGMGRWLSLIGGMGGVMWR